VFFAISRDHLLPNWFAKVHPRFGTPYRISIIIGLCVALIATFTSVQELAELVNFGTLLAFILVSVGIVVLRRTNPDLKREFRVPWVPLLPALAVLACLYLLISLPIVTWIRFVVWLVIGIVCESSGTLRARSSHSKASHRLNRASAPHSKLS
jgi:APA family basic amino acid/polyamine antiporter